MSTEKGSTTIILMYSIYVGVHVLGGWSYGANNICSAFSSVCITMNVNLEYQYTVKPVYSGHCIIKPRSLRIGRFQYIDFPFHPCTGSLDFIFDVG